VTLRITAASDRDACVLRLAGRLRAEELPELETSVAAGARVLDLSDLVAADEAGVAALRRLHGGGIEIRNASRYLALLLG
jgi:hypothetical protein